MTGWADPRGGQGSWTRTERRPLLPSLAALVALAIGVTLWIGLVTAGRSVMCSTHGDALSYCHPHHAVAR